jgi:hypothetical protein
MTAAIFIACAPFAVMLVTWLEYVTHQRYIEVDVRHYARQQRTLTRQGSW